MAEFAEIVDLHYQPLYRFAFSLTEDTERAADLVQRAFVIWGRKEPRPGDRSSARTGLFATLYREHLGSPRRELCSPGNRARDAGRERDSDGPDADLRLSDAEGTLGLLAGLEETFRAPLALFYLQQHSYREIAAILDVPIGTVMSRIARGKEQLHRRMLEEPASADRVIVDFEPGALKHSNG